jgi:hypothetical protein
MAFSRTGDRRRERGRLWPFGPAAALAGTVTLLVLLTAAFAALKSASDWPADELDQWVLLALFGLALLPVLLAVLDRMSLSGGSLEVRGVKVAFARRPPRSTGLARAAQGSSENCRAAAGSV